MTCLLVAATSLEISPFLDFYRNQGNDLRKDIQLDILVTGIGLTASTYSIVKQLNIKRPDIVIQAGIGGCFDRNIPLASVFTVKQDRIADNGVMEGKKFCTLFDTGLASPNKYPFKKGWLVNKGEYFKKIKLQKISAISVNEISTHKQRINFYRKTLQPIIESMEGAALHYACLMEKVEFIQLRSISNYVGERDKKKWKIQASIKTLNKELINLLQTIKNVSRL